MRGRRRHGGCRLRLEPMRAPFVLAFALAAAGCGAPSPGPGGSGGAAGAGGSGPTDLEVTAMMYTTPDTPEVLCVDGDSFELWRAPQGGHVMVVGARVAGLESDTIELRARLRDAESGWIVAEEARTVVMDEVPGEPGVLQTDRRTRSQAAHVPVCPDYDDDDIVDREHILEVEVTELYADFSQGTALVRVVPACMQEGADQERCRCECSAGYTLGKCSGEGAP